MYAALPPMHGQGVAHLKVLPLLVPNASSLPLGMSLGAGVRAPSRRSRFLVAYAVLPCACRVLAVETTSSTCASQGQDPKDPDASPLRAPDVSGLPPALILTAEVDALRDEAEQYAARLSAAGVKTRVKRFQGHWHNSMLQDTVFADPAQRCYGDVAAFLQDVFSGNI